MLQVLNAFSLIIEKDLCFSIASKLSFFLVFGCDPVLLVLVHLPL